jgi:hypothetical protein
MHSFARLDRSFLDSTSFKLDRGLSVLSGVGIVPAPGRADLFQAGWRYPPAPHRRLSARRTPRYGVLWLIIDR